MRFTFILSKAFQSQPDALLLVLCMAAYCRRQISVSWTIHAISGFQLTFQFNLFSCNTETKLWRDVVCNSHPASKLTSKAPSANLINGLLLHPDLIADSNYQAPLIRVHPREWWLPQDQKKAQTCGRKKSCIIWCKVLDHYQSSSLGQQLRSFNNLLSSVFNEFSEKSPQNK